MVLRVLTTDQKELLLIRVSQEWLEADEEDGIFSRVITGHESWLFKYAIKKKMGWNSLTSAWLAASEKTSMQSILNQGNTLTENSLKFCQKTAQSRDWW